MTVTTCRGALAAAAFFLFATATALPVLADAGHGHGGATGEPGTAADAGRAVEIEMFENYYEPESIAVTAGETVRLVIHNRGDLVHEFNIGTAAMHADHLGEMQMMVDHGVLMSDHIDMDAAKAMQESMGHGMHDDPNSVLLEPGQTGEIVWTFPQDGEIEFACNIPGHYEAGMQGRFKLGH